MIWQWCIFFNVVCWVMMLWSLINVYKYSTATLISFYHTTQSQCQMVLFTVTTVRIQKNILHTRICYLCGVHPVAIYYHTFQIYLQSQLRLLLLYFSLFTTCFGPYGPSSGEIQYHTFWSTINATTDPLFFNVIQLINFNFNSILI
jgi:hypothetical protein